MQLPDLYRQRRFIREIAPFYAADRWADLEKVRGQLSPLQQMDIPCPVLELGAGAGTVLKAVENWWSVVVGVEIVMEMLEEARRRCRSPLVRADGCFLPFGAAVFGLVLLWGNTLGPIPGRENRIALLREARRVLRPDGVLAISVINRFASLRRMLQPHEYQFRYRSRSDSWVSDSHGFNRTYGYGELKRTLKACGFTRFRRISPRFDAGLAVIAYP